MEKLTRWREPLAVILLVAGGIRVLIGIVAVPLLAGPEAYESLATSAMWQAGRSVDVLLMVALAAAAGWCLRAPVAPRATGIAVAAVVVIGVAVLTAFGYALIGLGEDSPYRGIEFGYTAIGLVVPTLAGVGVLLGLQAAPRPTTVNSVAAPPQVLAEHTIQIPHAAPPSLPPTWQPEQATGRVWHSAGDAARGEPGAGWSQQPGAGWQPIPGPGEPGQQQRPEHPAP